MIPICVRIPFLVLWCFCGNMLYIFLVGFVGGLVEE
jgi:hypothetical protein